jgi:hypothetical protein
VRTPDNPLKLAPQLQGYKLHRIIMPVYIPNHENYYKDAYRIFEISLASLIESTKRDRVNITIINNASVPEVEAYVLDRVRRGEVDQYVFNAVNRGKGDAIVAAAKGSYEPLVTFTDADVLFSHGWIEDIERIYHNFPGAGAVSPFPTPNLKFTFTVSVWLAKFFSIKRGKVVSSEDLDSFAQSIGLPDFFKEKDKRTQYYIRKNNVTALVGAGHFVCTYHQGIFKSFNYTPTKMGLKGGLKKIDQNVDVLGLFRLSLPVPKVYHMGNVYSPDYERMQSAPENGPSVEVVLQKARSWLPYLVREKLFLVVRLLCKIGLK